MDNSTDQNQPTKEPFTSTSESTAIGGSGNLFGLVAAPFAAVGGIIDQVTRKFTRAAEEPTPTSTPTTKD